MRPTRRTSALIFALLFGAMACDRTEPESKPEGPPPEAPKITATPAPGHYELFALDVTITSAPDVELTYQLDRDPNPEKAAWSFEKLSVRLLRDASVRVLARDKDGALWGPYAFEYRLAQRDLTGNCVISQPARLYYGATAKIPLDVSYSLPTALSAVELRIGGKTKVAQRFVEEPRGVATLEIPPLTYEGAYDVQCAVTGPNFKPVEGNVVTVYVDTTPPVAAWQLSAPWAPPTHFKLQASDQGGAQVSHADLCDPSAAHCLPMEDAGGGLFTFATAFLRGTAGAYQVAARVYDGAGNVTQLAAPAVAPADYPTAMPPFLHPITLVTSPTYNLDAYLQSAGVGAPAEVRALDFTLLDGSALALADGWNEFLFRAAGQAGWETFGVYRAGVRIDLPARDPSATHAWLVYAGNGTIPVLQAAPIASVPVTAAAWTRPWFDVPHLFFVEDLDADGQWDDTEPFFYSPATESDGQWLRRGRPYTGSLTLATQATPAGTQTADFTCTGCTAGKPLRLQRRTAEWTSPVGRQTLAVDLASGPATGVLFPADANEACLFYWDEDFSGVPSGNEPRASGPCNAGAFALQRAAPLGALPLTNAVLVAGIPYGASVTGLVDVRDSANRLLVREPIGPLRDLDGTGAAWLSHRGWPATIRLWSSDAYVEAAWPGTSSPATTTITVDVKNELGEPVTAAAVETATGAGTDYRIFDRAISETVQVAYDPAFRPRLRARLDGYLSTWVYGDVTSMTLTLVSPGGAGNIHGVVRDSAGLPVTDAVLTWAADPYVSQTRAGSDGAFSLPALGTGTLTAAMPGGEAAAHRILTAGAGDQIQVDPVLPAAGAPRWPAGLVTTLRASGFSGAHAVTLYTDRRYVWGDLDAGKWSVAAAPNLQREFVTPGAVPGLDLRDPAWLYFPWSAALLEADLEVRCGARLQTLPFGTSPMIDSPCWEWYAKWGSYSYFLGRPHPVGGMPNAGLEIWYAQVKVNGTSAAFTPVVLRDLMFNRTITATTNATGDVRVAVPRGYYRAETQTGGVFNDKGAPAVFPISHRSRADSTLSYP